MAEFRAGRMYNGDIFSILARFRCIRCSVLCDTHSAFRETEADAVEPLDTGYSSSNLKDSSVTPRKLERRVVTRGIPVLK